MPPGTHQQPEEPSEGISSGPRLCNNDLVLGLSSPIDDLKKTAGFIDALRGATVLNGSLRQYGSLIHS
jgi:hypothetical protein